VDDRPEDILVLRPYGDNGEASVLPVDNRASGGGGFDLPSSSSLLDGVEVVFMVVVIVITPKQSRFQLGVLGVKQVRKAKGEASDEEPGEKVCAL
jgi:hypothetical protein